MKSLDQFVTLTETETLNTNGGGLLSGVLGNVGTAVNSLGASVGVLSIGATTALTLVGAGAGSALTSIGAGAGKLLGSALSNSLISVGN